MDANVLPDESHLIHRNDGVIKNQDQLEGLLCVNGYNPQRILDCTAVLFRCGLLIAPFFLGGGEAKHLQESEFRVSRKVFS